MAAKITRLPQPASHTIEQVFDEFLGDQRRRLRPRTLSKYEDVLGLLRDHLNGYAYQSLSTAEAALFDRYYNAPGDKHLEFCQLFGPDKIVANLGGFLGYFMIRKVVAGQDLKRAGVGLIRFRGHRPKGGYDGQNGIKAGRETSATTVL